MSRARLYAQLAWVACLDATALRHEYELNSLCVPVVPTAEELAEAERLDSVAAALRDRARLLGWAGGGLDAAFGDKGKGEE